MGTLGRLPTTLALLAALAAAPGCAQEAEEECPNPEGWRPSPEELQATLQAHEEWLGKGGIPGRAILCSANLEEAQLQGARLTGAQLQGAYLVMAQLQDANLSEAELQDAVLVSAQLQGARLAGANLQSANLAGARLQGAVLSGAELQDAILYSAQLQGARLAFANLTGALYAPVGLPDSYVEGITGLSTVHVPYDDKTRETMVSGLVQLRELLQRAGLRDSEREVTYAIERNKTHHALVRWQQQPLAALEGAFRLVAFEWPVGYGLYPGFALQLLLWSIGGFALLYLVPLTMAGTGGIHRVWSEGRLEARSSTAELVWRAKVERLRPRGWWGLKRLGRALQFSVFSAFHLGFREFNVGTWLARLQTREYTLRATGWVRAVAGFQSLLSVYLLALWALTYFGRPFQ